MTLPKFEVGDYAAHKYADLDARPVVAVEGTKIRLMIGSVITDPVPMSNYRRIPQAKIERAVLAHFNQEA